EFQEPSKTPSRPLSFEKFLDRLKDDSAYYEMNRDLVCRFISWAHENGKFDLSESYVSRFNIRKLVLAHCMCTGEVDGSKSYAALKEKLGPSLLKITSDKSMSVEYTVDGKLAIKGSGVDVELAPAGAPCRPDAFANQIPRAINLSEQDIQRLNKRFSGKFELV